MREYLSVMKRSVLFRGIEEDEILAMLKCLQAHIRSYEKKDFLYRNGDHLLEMGLVLQGSVHLIKEDYWGKRSILARIPEGQIFGEVFACLRQQPLPGSQLYDNMHKEGFCDHHDHFENSTPESEYKTCLAHAEKIGIGSREYELIEMK